jgi:hypothetical protein
VRRRDQGPSLPVDPQVSLSVRELPTRVWARGAVAGDPIPFRRPLGPMRYQVGAHRKGIKPPPASDKK